MDIPVYEYYDDYEEIWSMIPEEKRAKVQYIELGEVSQYTIAICYIGELKHIASIGKNTHNKAWIKKYISKTDAIKFVKDGIKYNKISIQKYQEKYNYLIENQSTLDSSHILKEGFSTSTYDGYWNVSFLYNNENTYSKQFAKAIKAKIDLFNVVNTFLNKNNSIL